MTSSIDRYLNTSESIKRLLKEKEQYKSLFIAFDFDNTVFDYHQVGDTYQGVETLLIEAKRQGHYLILFTGNEGEKLNQIVQYCREHGYEPNYVNESPVMNTRKPYYNILLDDRAGLSESYKILKSILYV